MGRYIDVEKIDFKGVAVLDENLDLIIPLSEVRKAIQMTPTADVVPRITAQWILHSDGSGTCTGCHRTQKAVYDDDNHQAYCGSCGARMGVSEETLCDKCSHKGDCFDLDMQDEDEEKDLTYCGAFKPKGETP